MNPTVDSVLVALLWAAGGALLAWVVTIPLHRRSLGWLLTSVVLTSTVASVSAVVGSVRGMFLSVNDLATVVSVAVVSGMVAAVAAGAASRRLTRDNQALRDAVAELDSGRMPRTDGRPLTTELEHVRRELADTAERLARSRHRERSLDASRRELVAWVSHDLRTPLAGLRAMSEALEDGVVEEPEIYIKQMRTEVDRLALMVDDLFELSRIQAGEITPITEQVSLDDLVSDCIASLAPLAAVHGVRLTGARHGSATVTGNGHELNRALTNLMANAIRHTRVDGVVKVSVRVGSGRVEVAVRDECGGIAPDTLDRLFDVGFRGEQARTPRPNDPAGAGLGLAIARGIVEAHSGTVDVANVPGGCNFTVRLPIAA